MIENSQMIEGRYAKLARGRKLIRELYTSDSTPSYSAPRQAGAKAGAL